MKSPIFILALLISVLSCDTPPKSPPPTISFYHWKSKAIFSESQAKALTKAHTSTIYLHYFDVDFVKGESSSNQGLFPKYVLKEVDSAYKNFQIIPVVFMTNESLKESSLNRGVDLLALSIQIRELIDQISLHHFHQKHTEIQLDCDWTESTKVRFFRLINLLKMHYTVSATIRLHQIKYPDKTGVPPIDNGTLMLYNMGDLADMNRNSIVSADIVRQYIDHQTDYPLELTIALPLFSQTILKSNRDQIKIITEAERALFEVDRYHFEQVTPTLFEVKNDTLYSGFYLSKGYQIKLEEADEEEIIAAYALIKDSQLKTSGVIFYHLADAVLADIELDKLLEKL